MQETVPVADANSVGPDENTLVQRRNRWSWGHTIWLLMLLSLLPGVVIALDREVWLELPAGVRAAVYLTSALLIVAACGLIMHGSGKQDDG
jgi:hypothetical protein